MSLIEATDNQKLALLEPMPWDAGIPTVFNNPFAVRTPFSEADKIQLLWEYPQEIPEITPAEHNPLRRRTDDEEDRRRRTDESDTRTRRTESADSQRRRGAEAAATLRRRTDDTNTPQRRPE